MEALSVAALQYGARLELHVLSKPPPYVLPLQAKECAGKHHCWRATQLGMSASSSTLPGVSAAEWEEEFFWLSWIKARLLPLDFSKKLAWDAAPAAPPKYVLSLCAAYRQSHPCVKKSSYVLRVWPRPELKSTTLSVYPTGAMYTFFFSLQKELANASFHSLWTER